MSTLNIKQIPNIPTSKIINFEEEVEQICGDGRSIQNQNPVITATDPLFHWEGTLEEYIEQDIEHTHPEWVCFINNDDTSESFDNRITNTATVIPQDIKLEWGENFIKLKAGSVLYIPNGFESDGVTKKFDKIVLEEDLIRYTSDEGTPNSTKDTIQFITYSRNEIATLEWTHHIELTEIIKTGTVNPTETSIMGFYNTATNKYYYHTRDGVDWETSFPIAIITRHQEANGGYSYVELNQVFNGMGYFADYVYVLPGVSGLAPNGFNEDGTLKHNRIVVNKVILQHIEPYTTSNMPIAVGYLNGVLDGVLEINYQNNYYNQETDPEANWCIWYKHSENKLYYRQGEGYTVYPEYDQYNGFLMGFLSRNNGVVTRLSTRPAFEAVNASDFDEYKDESVDYKNISNCITKIPQDIKLELNTTNNTLTLKAGSKIYVPNGFEVDGVTRKFDTIIIPEDIVRDVSLETPPTANDIEKFFVSYSVDTSSIDFNYITTSNSGSGSVPSYSSAPMTLYYKTDTNRLYSIKPTTTQNSLPLGIITREAIANTGYYLRKLDKVFNGFGFIGKIVYSLPGVKGLIPDGRNPDGTLKSKEILVQKVRYLEIDFNAGHISRPDIWVFLTVTDMLVWGASYGHITEFKTRPVSSHDDTNRSYIVDENHWIHCYNNTTWQPYDYTDNIVKLFSVNTNADRVISINDDNQYPLRAVDYNDTVFIAHQALPSHKVINLTLEASGTTYKAPADGYYILRWWSTGSTYSFAYFGIQNGNLDELSLNTRVDNPYVSSGGGMPIEMFIPVSQGQKITVVYEGLEPVSDNTHPDYKIFRFIYANGSK